MKTPHETKAELNSQSKTYSGWSVALPELQRTTILALLECGVESDGTARGIIRFLFDKAVINYGECQSILSWLGAHCTGYDISAERRSELNLLATAGRGLSDDMSLEMRVQLGDTVYLGMKSLPYTEWLNSVDRTRVVEQRPSSPNETYMSMAGKGYIIPPSSKYYPKKGRGKAKEEELL